MRDNQPKHRQMRKEQRKLARQRASREGLPAVLIVCEGRETEPNYIQGLMEQLGVNAAAVRIERGGSRTDPEAHRHGEKTLVNSARQKTSVRIVATSPSIEFWLLLHFEYSTREFQNSEEVQRELQHAERLKAELRATGASRPDTDFPILVEQLGQMSQRY